MVLQSTSARLERKLGSRRNLLMVLYRTRHERFSSKPLNGIPSIHFKLGLGWFTKILIPHFITKQLLMAKSVQDNHSLWSSVPFMVTSRLYIERPTRIQDYTPQQSNIILICRIFRSHSFGSLLKSWMPSAAISCSAPSTSF